MAISAKYIAQLEPKAKKRYQSPKDPFQTSPMVKSPSLPPSMSQEVLHILSFGCRAKNLEFSHCNSPTRHYRPLSNPLSLLFLSLRRWIQSGLVVLAFSGTRCLGGRMSWLLRRGGTFCDGVSLVVCYGIDRRQVCNVRGNRARACREYIQSVKNHKVDLIPRDLILPSARHLTNAIDTSHQDENVRCRHSIRERAEPAALNSLVRPGR